MVSLMSLPPALAEKLITSEYSSFYMVPAVAGYFVYVTLGSFSPKTHEHAFTAEGYDIVRNLKKGQVVAIPKRTYKEFYFPAYLKYWNTYRIHTVSAGIWLLTSFYNLRNPPKFGRLANGKMGYNRSTLHRISGYAYLVSGFAKAITVPMMAKYSHSLANWIRTPLATLGIWDVVSLFIAAYHVVVKRNIPEHRKWMIRNYCVGAGSIWVRVFGAVWASFDLSFMHEPAMFGEMNGYALLGGFYYGVLYGEWWLSKGRPARRRAVEKLMALLCLWVAIMGKRMYRKRRNSEDSGDRRTLISGCPFAVEYSK